MNSRNKGPELFQHLIDTLDSISQSDHLEELSILEIDILKEKLRTIYDRLHRLPQDKDVEEPDESREVVFKIHQEEEIDPKIIDETIYESETNPPIIDSEEILPDAAIEPENETTDEVISDEDEEVEPDLFSLSAGADAEKPTSVIDKIAEEKTGESIADQLQKKSKVENLKEVIGINEKFFFINELFEGSLADYNEAISSIDQQQSIDQARELLEQLSVNNKWQGKQEAIDQLNQFIALKFN